jgi:hypothetical protein
MKIFTLFTLAILLQFIHLHSAFAWGRRGHSIVCQTAAYLIADQSKNSGFFKNHSFDLGYYCNIPDLRWKQPQTYKAERLNHFMDLDIFEKQMQSDKQSFALDRLAFEKKFPQIPKDAGRAWWRIRELDEKLKTISKQLKERDLDSISRHALQADWLLHAGALGHYVGDLSMPMHLSSDYDAKSTGQSGLHSFFEEELVNEGFLGRNGTNLEADVAIAARKEWKLRHAKLAGRSVLELVQELSAASLAQFPHLVKTDREHSRKNIENALAAHRPMLITQMAEGAIYLAEIWRRSDAHFDANHFYDFHFAPTHIPYPGMK